MRKSLKQSLEKEREELKKHIKKNWDEECWENNIENGLFFTLEDMLGNFKSGWKKQK